MEPNSIWLVFILFAAAGGLLWMLLRRRMLLVRIGAAVLSLALAAGAGMAIVNDYYGYYQNWSQLSADISGSYASFAPDEVTTRTDANAGRGRIEMLTMPGVLSGITRSGLVYLPPQYFEAAFAHTAFPVVELLHGTPGSPSAWVVHLNIAAVASELMTQHKLGPTVFVMPTMSVGRHYEECVNAPRALDDTYITQDVRADIESDFRVSHVPAEWGIAGYSSGGYCAANLALRHRGSFGAAAIMDGYYRPTDGPAAAALHYDPAAEAANNPLLSASRLQPGVSPLPSFWVSAGTGVKEDIAGAHAFTAALHGVERVTLYQEPHAGHNFYAWQSALPLALSWLWLQLAPPSLRTDFPIAGGVSKYTIPSESRSTPTHSHHAASRHD